ncbi:MAG: AI-2E family transporter [Candidatus Promineifilaceae bacterium]
MEEDSSWSVATRYFALILLIGALLWLLVAARELIGPLVLSALIAFVLNPLVNSVSEKVKLSRNWVVLLVYVLFVVALVVVGMLVAPELPQVAERLKDQLDNIVLLVEQVAGQTILLFGTQVSLESLISSWPALTQSVTGPDRLINMFAATSQNLVWVLLVLVTTYYLLLDGARLRDWLFSLVPDAQKPDVRILYDQVRNVWNQYLQGQLRLMAIVGVATGIAAMVIGLPGALAFGVLAGLFDIILSVGPLIVMIVGAIVAYVAGSNHLAISNVWFAVLVVVLFGGINVVENIWLRPRIMGNSLRLHPAIVFIAVVGALALAGVLMALIIVPLIGSALVIGRYLYCKILDIEPWPDIQGEREAVPTAETDRPV